MSLGRTIFFSRISSSFNEYCELDTTGILFSHDVQQQKAYYLAYLASIGENQTCCEFVNNISTQGEKILF